MTFTDSSTAPRYHRSWIGRVRNGVLTITVDSYGKVVAKGSFPVPPTIYPQLGRLVDGVRTAKNGTRPKGCVGGTANSVTVRSGGTTVVAAKAESCGGAGPKSAAITNVQAAFLALVGDFDIFAKRGADPSTLA